MSSFTDTNQPDDDAEAAVLTDEAAPPAGVEEDTVPDDVVVPGDTDPDDDTDDDTDEDTNGSDDPDPGRAGPGEKLEYTLADWAGESRTMLAQLLRA